MKRLWLDMNPRNVNKLKYSRSGFYSRCNSRNVYLLLEALGEKLCMASKLQKQQTKFYTFPERGADDDGRFFVSNNALAPLPLHRFLNDLIESHWIIHWM